ncbi:MAG: hypothetical protein B7X91_02565 [Hydrogenophilales bacterium 17-64-11]|nr:MAG: hypothetical protein B7X91_02565 [Hydrogenophilales bacterium 17-64-11]
MSGATYIRGLVSSESHQETSVTDEELCRVSDLLDGGEKPLTGFELHLMAVLAGKTSPITPKEAVLAGHFKVRNSAPDTRDEDAILEDALNEMHADEAYKRQEQELNSELLAECWGYAESSSQSEETGWYYEEEE